MSVPDPATVDWVPLWPTGITVPPIQPSVRVYRSTAQVIGGGWSPLIFDSVRWDTGSPLQWSASFPTRLTCQIAGTYFIWGMVQLNAAAVGGLNRMAGIRLNGSIFISEGGMIGATIAAGGSNPHAAASSIHQLNVGDYVELTYLQDSGSNVNTEVSSATGRYGVEFAMALVGGMQGPPGPGTPSYGISLPASPVDGQEAILVDSISNPTYQWRFRYNAGSTSAYKWEFIGGADASARVYTAETTTTTGTWLDLATVGPRIVVPRAGEYNVMSSAMGIHTAAGGQIWISNYIGTVTAGSGRSLQIPAANNTEPFGVAEDRFTLAANDELRVRYHNSTAGTATWHTRWLRVVPVRVS